ncbi:MULTISPECIES: ABC transporter ATP-binding protein [Streptomyces]|uniref:Putative ABC transport system ATP-binding protein n=1 Tax=Streptomyces scabiei (strain 87.22) TaxID=680198 RepID=C9ZHI6_STRSW|nr:MULTISPECIES: ABC transporter ATP-binding protein [Streptomyces]MBP5865353.1 ABC transporter ATP-binding protein [Streptomyces sp. LBUM 1484]MBP5872180.1 ABC transporter ATP-binding protein [Streptomyces sp. LBUM 1485]MBP5933428.1 ABC transporter ATP-binding protein [Streptomyces sp. LBUM 1479]KFG10578.1 multidrug ABC transporter ATPase [Streptomyces scabiei]MBP5873958.1 ABC transporter ATP-binding protein [Streptomyces sp. LBUM 1477]
MNDRKEHHVMSAVSAADLAPTSYAWEIRATGLKVRAGRKRMAVDGLDLSLGTGVHGLLGPNGAGKTTLIRALATVLRPAGGTLELLGESASGLGEHRALRRRIGYLPQEFGYYKRFTVREFVEYMAWLKEVPEADIPAAVQRAVERVGLADRADDRMKSLSGGMVRRVGIAQAIVNDPVILLLDEPTAGLDPAQRLRFRRLLQELGSDTCVVVSTHLVEDVAAACTDVVLFAEGRLVFQGTPDELAAAGGPDHVGDSPLERGYSALLLDPRQERGSW